MKRLGYLLLLLSCQTAPRLDYQLYKVSEGRLELSQPETGELGSTQEVRVNAPFAGKLVQLLPEGSVLKKGQVLGRLETTSKVQDRTSAELSLNEARIDLKLANLERQRRMFESRSQQDLAALDVRLESTRLRQLREERDTVALTRVRETLRTLKQQMAIFELEARERKRLFDLGYLSREERDQAQLQRDQARQQLRAQEAELAILEAGPRKEELDRQLLMVEKARAAQRQATQAQGISQRVADVQMRSADMRIKKYDQRRDYYASLVNSGTLISPVAGTLVYGKLKVGEEQVPIKSGDAVQEGVQVVKLVDLAQPVLRLLIHEIDAPRIKVGQAARLRFDAWPDHSYAGKVTRLLPVARQPQQADQQEVRLFACEIKLLESDNRLRPGMTAQAEIVTSTLAKVLQVPTQAIIGEGKQTACQVLVAGRVEQRTVVTGPSDARMTVIQSGLKAGDEIILNPRPLPAAAGAHPGVNSGASSSASPGAGP